jgi:hypothetical protein
MGLGPRVGVMVTATGTISVSVFGDTAKERRVGMRLLDRLQPRLDEIEAEVKAIATQGHLSPVAPIR